MGMKVLTGKWKTLVHENIWSMHLQG